MYDLPIKLMSIDNFRDRIKYSWLCLMGRVLHVSVIIKKNEFYLRK
jgi:hypothetical protein